MNYNKITITWWCGTVGGVFFGGSPLVYSVEEELLVHSSSRCGLVFTHIFYLNGKPIAVSCFYGVNFDSVNTSEAPALVALML